MEVTVSVIGRINPFSILLLLTIAGVFAQNRPAFADYYKYTDNKGTICITNDPKAVPGRYRSTMKVIREEKPADGQLQTPTGRIPAVQEQSSSVRERLAAPTVRTQSRFGKLVTSFPWLEPLIAIGSVVATFLFLIKLRAMVSSPQLAKPIALVLFLGVFVFVFKIYVDHLVTGHTTFRTKILGISSKTSASNVLESAAKTPGSLETPAGSLHC